MKWGISCTAENEEQLGKVLAALKPLGVTNIGYDAVGSMKRRTMEEIFPAAVEFVQKHEGHLSRKQIIDAMGSSSLSDKVIKMMVKQKIIKKKPGNGFIVLKKGK